MMSKLKTNIRKERIIVNMILAMIALADTMMPGIPLREAVDGWGIQMFISVLGMAGIFYLMRGRSGKRSPILTMVSAVFAVFTLFGKSYMETESWDYVFYNVPQLCRAVLVGCGYSLIYKNCILFAGWLLEQMPHTFQRRRAGGKIEKWLFESHPFLGPIIVVWILAIPWLVCFFPGTVEPDARHQLMMAFGTAGMTGHHPILVTKLMGKCVYIGRALFHSDSMGIFIYTFFQFMMQSLAIGYAMYVLGYIRTPIMMRWGALAFYGLYPIFPIWGLTLVKDTGYYILILLFVTVLVHLIYREKESLLWWQTILLIIGATGIAIFRKEGCLTVLLTLFVGFIAFRKYRKIFVLGSCFCLLSVFMINGIYMKTENISKSSEREMLSIPLQQTARYVKEHYEEMTPEEKETLQSVFMVDLAKLADLYDPELSNPIKEEFILAPDDSDLKAYFGVWWHQLLKHPDTYVQAFLNHTYGYFYPDKKEAGTGEDIGVFQIAESPYFDIKFSVESDAGRNFLESYARLVKQLPIIGMLYSTGLHVWILMGCVFYLTAKRERRELMLYIPGICVFLVCIISPVNACVRYMLPVMILLPLHLGWLVRE